MPYVEGKIRQALHPITPLQPITPGELNYVISVLCGNYMMAGGGISYVKINEVIGVLECAKLELYRRIAANYEDTKKAINGDVLVYETLNQLEALRPPRKA